MTFLATFFGLHGQQNNPSGALMPGKVIGCFFCWKLLGFIPGGAPFSQLNRGVKDAVSATTKSDV